MGILSLLNSAPMYAICGGIIAFVAAVCIVFMVRAYRAGIAMGMDPVKLKRAITSSATFRPAERRHSAGRHRALREPRHTVAVAATVRHRRTAL